MFARFINAICRGCGADTFAQYLDHTGHCADCTITEEN